MEWINVEDRLPEDFEEVLFSDGKELFKGYFRKKDGDELYHHWNSVTDSSIDGVTHWMSLPEPPK